MKRESVGIRNPSPGGQYAVLRGPSKRKGKAGMTDRNRGRRGQRYGLEYIFLPVTPIPNP